MQNVKVIFLGGLGEVGRNCAAIEQDGRILIIDVGLMFPDHNMPGVDLVLPDFTYLLQRKNDIEAAIITHGHEDHMGALSYLLRDVSFPIYGSDLTLGLARNRIDEAGLLDRTEFRAVEDGDVRKIGPFNVEFVPVTHSVPHGFAIAVHTAQGVIFHTGDFKIDLNPIDGRRTDLARIGHIADTKGIRLLLSDSTNAEEEGNSMSESKVGGVLKEFFAKHKRQRIIVACFASHLHRVQQIVSAAIAEGRVIATLGRSMGKNVALAEEMGLLHIPKKSLVKIETIGDYPPEKVCVVSTGSQGEPLSALTLMASGQSRWLTLTEDDVVILSSHPIPGNEGSVGKVIDGLYRRGVEVVHSGLAPVHATGHARQEELKLMLSITRPEYFVPVHGEFRHLTNHCRIAMEMGVDPDNVLLAEDGDVVELSDDGVYFAGTVPAGYLYVDGTSEGQSSEVLRDRRILAEEGVVMVVVTLDTFRGEVAAAPEVYTRGWAFADEVGDIVPEAVVRVEKLLSNLDADALRDADNVRRLARKAVGSFVNSRTKRRPMIVPVVIEVSATTLGE